MRGSNLTQIKGHHYFNCRSKPLVGRGPLNRHTAVLLQAEAGRRRGPALARFRARVPSPREARSRGRPSAELSFGEASHASREPRRHGGGRSPARPAAPGPARGAQTPRGRARAPLWPHRYSFPRLHSPPALAWTRASSGRVRSKGSTSTWTSGRGRGAKAQVRSHTTTTHKPLPPWATSACTWQP